jgi:hypothetical protein
MTLNWSQIIRIARPSDFRLTLFWHDNFFNTTWKLNWKLATSNEKQFSEIYRFRCKSLFIWWTRRSCAGIIRRRSRCSWSWLCLWIAALFNIYINVIVTFWKAIDRQWTLSRANKLRRMYLKRINEMKSICVMLRSFRINVKSAHI